MGEVGRAAVVVVYAVGASRLAPFTWPIHVAVALPVVVIVGIGIRRGSLRGLPRQPRLLGGGGPAGGGRPVALVRLVPGGRPVRPLPHDEAANLAIWAVVGGGVLAWSVITAVLDRLPTAVDLLHVACRTMVVRWLLVLGWVWLGWHLFVRTSY